MKYNLIDTFIFNRMYVCLLAALCLACTSDPAVNEKAGGWNNVLQSIKSAGSASAPEKLRAEEYVAWVKEQKGITYNSVQNEQFLLSLIFNPPQLEAYSAALLNGEKGEKALSKYLDIQKGYYYCLAECTIKTESASDPIKKTDLLQGLKQQLIVVKNNTDTLPNVITEAFPSYVMNQPNKLLILIPDTDSLSSYQIKIHGSPFHLNDCHLYLSSETIQSFPLIKL
ncbi:hypothetical protein [Cytophaga hutchinsonii]|uniref:Lipoprotein n=1 Tax=Cytophaga hutchinsonii (strain ATCC 33406 / DSM 1761 / CIP 103989 / NBRC 15051 / NCIMB 9469 / D465) TaxID=269798 RepID=A0A6N4SR19_CYTH3|nr:hypothetical protein [Cytophaga hutchinsonii]ABG58791.1 hypothetical protein CHU_1520 [Cytophaga hutchinsonii ATCC 33406]SFX61939.1 hypothetical protein SAMN04487930_106184 [Cytophaga hutchinsonii ATCC 33406]